MIKIITVGNLKEKYLKQAQAEYLKRLKVYDRINVIETKEDLNDNPENEGKNILKHIDNNEYVIVLEINGKQYSSQNFAMMIDKLHTHGKSKLTFIIGGSNGLSEDIYNIADTTISLSKMTFPHQIARVLLLEQIYRCYKILKNEPYHK